MAYKQGLGYYVAGVAKAHANGDVDTFTVVGDVLVNLIYGKVTVAAGAACLVTVGANPTVGTGTTVAFAVATDIDPLDVGDFITLNYVAGTLTTSLVAVSGDYHFHVGAGTIFVRGSAVQGTSQWFVYYVPLTSGALVTAIP